MLFSVHRWRSAVWSVLALNLGWDWSSDATALKARYGELTATGDILRKITPWTDAGVYIVRALSGYYATVVLTSLGFVERE